MPGGGPRPPRLFARFLRCGPTCADGLQTTGQCAPDPGQARRSSGPLRASHGSQARPSRCTTTWAIFSDSRASSTRPRHGSASDRSQAGSCRAAQQPGQRPPEPGQARPGGSTIRASVGSQARPLPGAQQPGQRAAESGKARRSSSPIRASIGSQAETMPWPHYNLGTALLDQGKFDQAAAHCERASGYQSRHLPDKQQPGRHLFKPRKARRKRRHFTTMRSLSRTSPKCITIARI